MIVHNAVLMASQLRKAYFAFAHSAQHRYQTVAMLFDSYHCSRYNTQTKRLTTQMFEGVIVRIAAHLG